MAKKKNELSFEEEALMWCSYRYAIGRKTYVSSMAYYIAKKYYPLLSEARMIFTAQDIRREIEQHFNWGSVNFHYDGTVNYCDRHPYEDCVKFIMEEIVAKCDTDNTDDIQKELCKIDRVEVYHEHYKDGEPHRYRVIYKPDYDIRSYMSQSDVSEYQHWAALAAVFDKEHYKKVHTKLDDGTEQDIICFETWVEDSRPIEDQPGYYKHWPWHWKKVYVGVDNFINDGERAGYIYEPYIVSVEDYDAREDKTNKY